MRCLSWRDAWREGYAVTNGRRTTPTRPCLHSDDIALRVEAQTQPKVLLVRALKRQRFIRNAIVGVFIVLGVIGFLIGKWLEND